MYNLKRRSKTIFTGRRREIKFTSHRTLKSRPTNLLFVYLFVFGSYSEHCTLISKRVKTFWLIMSLVKLRYRLYPNVDIRGYMESVKNALSLLK